MIVMPGDNPLTEAELDELEDILLDIEGLDEPMDVSMLDGYFAALMSGPNTILPSEWMRWVWDVEQGEATPEFANDKQAQRVMRLMMRHMNDVTTVLLTEPEHYEPVLLESPGNDGPVPVIDEWCVGFMKGVSLDAEGWAPVTIGHPEWMSTIVLHGTEEGWDELERKNPSLDEHRALAAGLGDTVRKIHAFFLEGRKARAGAGETGLMQTEPVRRAAPKVGRNDPCPCGSGKKYKHCHGGGESVH